MGNIRCTAKLLKELGAKPANAPNQSAGLSDWHANLLWLDHRKYVLFTNDQTLYSFIIRLSKKPSSQNFEELFRLGLLKSVISEGLEDAFVEQVRGGLGSMVVAKTNNRSVLGSMNDLVLQIKCMARREGAIADSDLSEINRELNRTPMGAIKYNVGIEELKRILDEPD